jgi:hypothetical protein
VLFFLENFDKFLILQSCKENPGTHNAFFFFFFLGATFDVAQIIFSQIW